MMEVVILIGLQASGKSTFYRLRFAGTHALVSKDLYPSARNKQRRQMLELTAALEAGKSVVVDNTNSSMEVRAPLIEIARAHHASVTGYYFHSRVSDCIERNRARAQEERVPDVAIYATVSKLQTPRVQEGFDALYFVRQADGGDFVVEEWIEGPDGCR